MKLLESLTYALAAVTYLGSFLGLDKSVSALSLAMVYAILSVAASK